MTKDKIEPFQRFAIYYAPEDGPLYRFASKWLGWDASAGREIAQPVVEGLPRPIAEITETPRKYGFHATIKPPFRLADGKCAEDLACEVERLARTQPPITLDGLELSQLGRFLALTPIGDQQELMKMADRFVKSLDTYRKQSTENDLIKRRKAGLSDRQLANLHEWGYPYVLQDFRFHMTLTGRMPKAELTKTHKALTPLLAPLLPKPFTLDSLCLFGEAADGRFHLIQRYALTGVSDINQ